MGKIQILTKEQKLILAAISEHNYIQKNFYFTGGTVLSEFYLQHRYSEDLDFFTEERFDNQIIFALVSDWSKKYHFKFTSRFAEVVYRFDLTFANGANFKVDFGYYPYKRIDKGESYQNIEIDSLRDIASNKLTTVSQRTDVKDFVDLYFILRDKYTIWDLLYSTEVKFKSMDIDIELLAMDMLKVDDFVALPKMIKPLTLDELKNFLRQKAKEIGRKVTA
ncbi:nucleotidyl transferase AbiEii/AbiGii toxin family protein [Candidatus Gottesmanbacteria bacterium]|nr:nucleotidyl transferase AbiEii/AbiGii toxin family protein [Candidatus Gottesmanbacteria bacterium]MBI5451936.1 nucleotidyl transferase AbiEii/AbiGii toxin family protein [Candidatus Gottesmanbacteria bacterium]